MPGGEAVTTHLTAFPDHVPKFCAGTVYRPGGVEEVKPPSPDKTTASLLEAGFFLVKGMDPIKTFGPVERSMALRYFAFPTDYQ